MTTGRAEQPEAVDELVARLAQVDLEVGIAPAPGPGLAGGPRQRGTPRIAVG